MTDKKYIAFGCGRISEFLPFEEAQGRARSLANSYPGQQFYVGIAVGFAQTGKPPVEWHEMTWEDTEVARLEGAAPDAPTGPPAEDFAQLAEDNDARVGTGAGNPPMPPSRSERTNQAEPTRRPGCRAVIDCPPGECRYVSCVNHYPVPVGKDEVAA